MLRENANYQAIVLDIEGTTTPISFVYEVLFPFAHSHVKDYLVQQWHTPQLQTLVKDFRQQVMDDKAHGIENGPEIAPPDSTDEQIIESLVKIIHWQMAHDRKITPLKTLQGYIWENGYRCGQLKGVVFDDVPGAIKYWNRQQTPVYIYSSGSINAQKLLFAHSSAGDLTPLLSGYFDTTTGPKKEPESYQAIAAKIAQRPASILFATDNLDEAKAAKQAGLQAVILNRPGNHPLPEHSFPVFDSFQDIVD